MGIYEKSIGFEKYLYFKFIQWIHNLIKTFCGDVGINLCGFAACMPHQCLYIPQIGAVLEQMRTETMP